MSIHACNAARTADALERLDDLEWVLGSGEWPPRACRRLGWTVSGASAAARRHGRVDLANMLATHVQAAA